MKHIVLDAYLNKNLGDDLFVKLFMDNMPDNINVSAKPVTSYSDFCKGVSLEYGITDKIKNKLHIRNYAKVKEGDTVVILGGSMFIEQGLTHKNLRKEIMKKYPKGCNLFVIGSNFGPYANDYYIEEYRELFRRADDVCFRDSESLDLFSDLSNTRKESDVVFGINTADYVAKMEKKVIISAINLSNRKNLETYKHAYEEKMAEIADYYCEKGYSVTLMSFCRGQGDEEVAESIAHKMRGQATIYNYDGCIDSALDEIATSEYIIGTRFHSVVLGFAFGKKVLPIIYSKKTTNMLFDAEYNGEYIEVKNIECLDVQKIDEMIGKIKDIDSMRASAKRQFKSLSRFVRKGA